MVLPNPQVHSFEVPAGAVYRVCVASDGLWDVCSFAHSAEVMRNCASVDKASKELLKIAEREYLEERGHDTMDDDTTVLVIELNLSGIMHSPPAGAGGGGCCSLM